MYNAVIYLEYSENIEPLLKPLYLIRDKRITFSLGTPWKQCFANVRKEHLPSKNCTLIKNNVSPYSEV